jgi:hypothetical protein
MQDHGEGTIQEKATELTGRLGTTPSLIVFFYLFDESLINLVLSYS